MSVSLDKNIYFSDLEDKNYSLDELNSISNILFNKADRLKSNPDDPEYIECKKKLRLVLDKKNLLIRG